MPQAALEYLTSGTEETIGPIVVLFGDDAFLKRHVRQRIARQVLGDDEDSDLSLRRVEGPAAQWSEIEGELQTRSLFGSAQRMVVVDDAEGMVSKYRGELEQYAERPSRSGVLVLDAKSWNRSTRLAKAVAKVGMAVDCRAPRQREVLPWLRQWASSAHAVELSANALRLLVDRVGPELGLLDQELAKLALVAPPNKKIGTELIIQHVGAWRTQTAWEMIDAALDGNAPEAIRLLEGLLTAGEHPVGVLSQIGATLRRLSDATHAFLDAEARGRPISLADALTRAGVNRYFLEKSQKQLMRLGRHRGQQLSAWLLEADLHLKGASRLAPRHVVEHLLVRLAAPARGASNT